MMLFEHELEVAQSNEPFPVYAREKRTRNDCPYLVISGTGCAVHAMPAKGFRKTGEVLLYWNNWSAHTNYSLGVYKRECLVELILEFGRMQPRNMWEALKRLNMVPDGAVESHASDEEE